MKRMQTHAPNRPQRKAKTSALENIMKKVKNNFKQSKRKQKSMWDVSEAEKQRKKKAQRDNEVQRRRNEYFKVAI